MLKVQSEKVKYNDHEIISEYDYQTTEIVQNDEQEIVVKPVTRKYVFKTERKVPKLGYVFLAKKLNPSQVSC